MDPKSRGERRSTSSLGAGPRATTADTASNAANARAVGGESAAQLSAASKLRCPVGMALAAGSCVETVARSKRNLYDAAVDCSKTGRRSRRSASFSTSPERTSRAQNPFEGVEPFYTNSSG
jgi:hypothetical protein